MVFYRGDPCPVGIVIFSRSGYHSFWLFNNHTTAVIVSVESDPVVHLEIVTTSSTTLGLQWSPPASSNAPVQFYVLSYRELQPLACMTGPGSWSPLLDVDADRRQLELPDLLSYCKYEVTLSAYTVAGQGRATVAVATTDAAGNVLHYHFLIGETNDLCL